MWAENVCALCIITCFFMFMGLKSFSLSFCVTALLDSSIYERSYKCCLTSQPISIVLTVSPHSKISLLFNLAAVAYSYCIFTAHLQ